MYKRVRDLLQFEFAWVSINKSHKSMSIETSTKRLSWITFIFLPVMFASSLFGMNVDICKDNPDWRWYILVVGVFLMLTIIGWLIFKLNNRVSGQRVQLAMELEETESTIFKSQRKAPRASPPFSPRPYFSVDRSVGTRRSRRFIPHAEPDSSLPVRRRRDDEESDLDEWWGFQSS
ncbi:hypothetical protein V2G26_001910 [Clonostachys chloroleuca]